MPGGRILKTTKAECREATHTHKFQLLKFRCFFYKGYWKFRPKLIPQNNKPRLVFKSTLHKSEKQPGYMFENAKVVEGVDVRGNSSKILIIENLKKREAMVGNLENLQAVTGNEFSLFRGPDGQRVLIQGDSTQISILYKYTGEGWKWSGHSHPANPRPSSNDKAVLELFHQGVSMIKSVTGPEEVFDSSKDMSNWLPGWED